MPRPRDANLERLTQWYAGNKKRFTGHRKEARTLLYNFVQSCSEANLEAYLNFSNDITLFTDTYQGILKEAFFFAYATTLERIMVEKMPGHSALRPSEN